MVVGLIHDIPNFFLQKKSLSFDVVVDIVVTTDVEEVRIKIVLQFI